MSKVKIKYNEPANNFEKLKQMSLNDAALMLCSHHVGCEQCKFILDCTNQAEGYKKWLAQGVK